MRVCVCVSLLFSVLMSLLLIAHKLQLEQHKSWRDQAECGEGEGTTYGN